MRWTVHWTELPGYESTGVLKLYIFLSAILGPKVSQVLRPVQWLQTYSRWTYLFLFALLRGLLKSSSFTPGRIGSAASGLKCWIVNKIKHDFGFSIASCSLGGQLDRCTSTSAMCTLHSSTSYPAISLAPPPTILSSPSPVMQSRDQQCITQNCQNVSFVLCNYRTLKLDLWLEATFDSWLEASWTFHNHPSILKLSTHPKKYYT